MISAELISELATGLREQVLPRLGVSAGRAHTRTGHGGDVTFAIDEEAEQYLEQFIKERAPTTAFYSEDRGLVQPAAGTADCILIVDPIDGTRPALAGLESACVSVAAAPYCKGNPKMGDVKVGCIIEIKSGNHFTAERGSGLTSTVPVDLGKTSDLTRLFWSYGLRGRPVRPMIEVLAELIEYASVGGGTFDLGSITFDLTRILTGQMDAYVGPGARLFEEIPQLKEEFERVGSGKILNNSPYDLAAVVLCLEEGGAVVSDAYGKSLANRPLLGSGPDFQLSCVASSNSELQDKLLAAVDRGLLRVQQLYAGR